MMLLPTAVLLLSCIGSSLADDWCRKPVPLQPQTSCGPMQTMVNEGECLCCYYDIAKNPSIGIGFNLQRSDAAKTLSKYGLKLADVLRDCRKKTTDHCLTDQQAREIYAVHYAEAEECVDDYAPGLPPTKRAAVIDMAFMGCKKLRGFTEMQKALNMRDWNWAADEAIDSDWCRRLKARCKLTSSCIKGCTGQQCSTYAPGCSKSNPKCACGTTSDGNGYCYNGGACSQFADCSTCPAATGTCVVNSCCIRPICVSLEHGQACEDQPT